MFDTDPMCTQNAVKSFFCCNSSGLIHFSYEVNIRKVWEVVNKTVAPKYLWFVEIPLCICTKPGVGLTNWSTITTSPGYVATLFFFNIFLASQVPLHLLLHQLEFEIVAPRYLWFIEIPLCIGTKTGVGLTNMSTLTTSPAHVTTLFFFYILLVSEVSLHLPIHQLKFGPILFN